MMKSKITIKGSKKQGYILSVEDSTSCQDLAITEEELKRIYKLLGKLTK